jgi:hypothetical protein
VFTKLTEDYPELPEPYNNLAVIYAQQKQYDKAKQALEMAIRTHPSYATAHENLGDIYARLASQAYDKALQIDSSNSSAQNKLALIRDLMSVASPSRQHQASRSPNRVRPKPVKVARSSCPNRPRCPLLQAPAATPPATADGCTGQAGRCRQYGRCQSPSACGQPPGRARTSRPTSRPMPATSRPRPAKPAPIWDAERQKRINKPGAIQVSVERPARVAIDGDQRPVKFRQHYKSASLKTSSNKVLQMVKRDGKWLIDCRSGLVADERPIAPPVTGCGMQPPACGGAAEAAGKAPKHLAKEGGGAVEARYTDSGPGAAAGESIRRHRAG